MANLTLASQRRQGTDVGVHCCEEGSCIGCLAANVSGAVEPIEAQCINGLGLVILLVQKFHDATNIIGLPGRLAHKVNMICDESLADLLAGWCRAAKGNESKTRGQVRSAGASPGLKLLSHRGGSREGCHYVPFASNTVPSSATSRPCCSRARLFVKVNRLVPVHCDAKFSVDATVRRDDVATALLLACCAAPAALRFLDG